MKIGFIVRKDCIRCAHIVRRITDILPEDWEIIYDREAARMLNKKGNSIEQMEADILITVGGDGSVLRSLQLAKGPVLGINMGSLGFLSEVEIGEVESSVYKIIQGKYKIEETMKLRLTINGTQVLDSTNEVVLHSSQIAKIRKFRVFVDGTFFDSTTADGVIVATPIGSTSYSFSAGGPILYPTIDAMVVTYLAPFRSRSRPIVIPSTQEIQLRLFGKNQTCDLIVDGQQQFAVNETDDIRIAVSPEKARFVTFRNSFYERIREKLIRNVVN